MHPYLVVNVTCSQCRNAVPHDGDNFTCPTCGVSWDERAGDGDPASCFTACTCSQWRSLDANAHDADCPVTPAENKES